MDEAEECGRIALMRAGKLIALGSPCELEKQTYPSGLNSAGKKVTLEDVFLKLVEGEER
jgi:ABC-2 type transport system ATP-binding protein